MHDPDKTSSLTVVHMLNAKEGWVMGGKVALSGFEGRFWHTLDGGDTWVRISLSPWMFSNISVHIFQNPPSRSRRPFPISSLSRPTLFRLLRALQSP